LALVHLTDYGATAGGDFGAGRSTAAAAPVSAEKAGRESVSLRMVCVPELNSLEGAEAISAGSFRMIN
jgi:hypothetical protein